MPKPGQKSVTINEDTYKRAKKKADEEDKSVAGFVKELIDENTDEEQKAAEDTAS